MSQLFESCLLRAMRKVQRGEIVSVDGSGVFRDRYGDLPTDLFTALYVLHRDGHLERGPADHGGWITARLTATGLALLADWTAAIQQHPGQPHRPGR